MKTTGWILGCDPDSEKSGFALLNCATRTFEYVGTMTFPEAIRFFDSLAANEAYSGLYLAIEDSNTATAYNMLDKMNKRAVFAYGRSVGKCHGTYEHLCECADACGINVRPVKPLIKTWKGAKRKISHEELSSFVSGLPNRTNPEMRDAALIAWVTADFPIRIFLRK